MMTTGARRARARVAGGAVVAMGTRAQSPQVACDMLVGREARVTRREVGGARGSARDPRTVAFGRKLDDQSRSNPRQHGGKSDISDPGRHFSPRARGVDAHRRELDAMADWFVAQFLDEWETHKTEISGTPKYNKKCLEADFLQVSSRPELQCRGPAFPGDVKCRVADRLMNQFHNEFIRLRDWVELGEARKLVTDQHRLAHFLLRSREMVAQEVGACEVHRLEHIRNPFLTPSQCRHCVKNNDLKMLNRRDLETIESRRMQLIGALDGLKMRAGRTVEETVAEIVCERLERRTGRPRS